MANPFRQVARAMSKPAPRAMYAGAQGGRLYGDLTAGLFSADVEARGARAILRARARSLVRDNPYASGFLNELANNVVGPDGILLEAHVANQDGAKAKSTNRAIEKSWQHWGKPKNCCVDRRTSWRELQRLMITTVAMDGECFFRKIKYFGNEHAFALQFIDPDQVDDFFSRAPSAGLNEVRQGIEIDEYGAPVAYHIWSRQLSDQGARMRIRVPADEIIHRFVPYRGQQTRGVSWFAPALLNLKMLDGYTEAELVAARTASAKLGFLEQTNPELDDTPDDETADPDQEILGEPGTFEKLPAGYSMKLFDPKHPSVAFKDFTKTILRGISRGVNMAYTTLTGDLEAVNYSSIRAGLLSERDWYRTLQHWSVEGFHSEVYDAWLPNALVAGAVQVDTRLATDYREVRWRSRGWKWVNPKDDLLAAKLAIDLGLDSRTRLAGEQGRDWEEIVDELAHEIDVSESEGVDVTGDQKPAGAGPKASSLHARMLRTAIVAQLDGEDEDEHTLRDRRSRLALTERGA